MPKFFAFHFGAVPVKLSKNALVQRAIKEGRRKYEIFESVQTPPPLIRNHFNYFNFNLDAVFVEHKCLER